MPEAKLSRLIKTGLKISEPTTRTGIDARLVSDMQHNRNNNMAGISAAGVVIVPVNFMVRSPAAPEKSPGTRRERKLQSFLFLLSIKRRILVSE